VRDDEAGPRQQLSPLLQPEAAAVARVAQLLEAVVGRGRVGEVGACRRREDRAIGRDVVDERQSAPVPQDSARLDRERVGVGEVVGGDAAGDDVEALARER
jgi:hypothetical protein